MLISCWVRSCCCHRMEDIAHGVSFLHKPICWETLQEVKDIKVVIYNIQSASYKAQNTSCLQCVITKRNKKNTTKTTL